MPSDLSSAFANDLLNQTSELQWDSLINRHYRDWLTDWLFVERTRTRPVCLTRANDTHQRYYFCACVQGGLVDLLCYTPQLPRENSNLAVIFVDLFQPEEKLKLVQEAVKPVRHEWGWRLTGVWSWVYEINTMPSFSTNDAHTAARLWRKRANNTYNGVMHFLIEERCGVIRTLVIAPIWMQWNQMEPFTRKHKKS